MNVLVIGRSGQLAQALARHPWPAGTRVACHGRDTLDIAAVNSDTAIAAAIAANGASVVVNAAAYTAVDRAESEHDAAFALNRDGPGRLATACERAGAALIHVSTDSVFDGTKPSAYRDDDPVAPAGIYGSSKEAGERAVRTRLAAHVILRTSWVFGPDGHNFVKLMLRLGEGKDELRVVADQYGRPTAADDLAAAIAHVASRCAAGEAVWGTYHVAGDDAMSRIDQARDIFAAAAARGRKGPRLVPMSMREYAAAAPRPANAVLDCTRFAARFEAPSRPWLPALARCLDRLLPTAALGAAAQSDAR
jgi:dTDP-4-dehydrorhamnose reductase